VLVGALAALLLPACDAPPPAAADAGAAATAPSAAPTSSPTGGAHGAGPSAAPTATGAPSPGAPASTPAPTEVAAQHVLVAYKGAKNAPKSVTRSKADAKKRAEEARTKATGGADFAKVVEEYSDDAVTRDRLGSLGKFAHGGMVKPFADAAFALSVGGISEVVETDFGFHVIKRNQ
jgi:peptidyl-prolyl cis-trans isomerase NIMA-interacting 1